MDEAVQRNISTTQRIMKKVENYLKMLSVRRDDLIEDSTEIHSQLLDEVIYMRFCFNSQSTLIWLRVLIFQVTKHKQFMQEDIERKLDEIASKYTKLRDGAQQRYNRLNQLKSDANLDPNKCQQELNTIETLNTNDLNQEDLFSYDNLLELQLVQSNNAVDDFIDILKQRKILVLW